MIDEFSLRGIRVRFLARPRNLSFTRAVLVFFFARILQTRQMQARLHGQATTAVLQPGLALHSLAITIVFAARTHISFRNKVIQSD